MHRRQAIQSLGLAALGSVAAGSSVGFAAGNADKASFATVAKLILEWRRKDVDAVMAHIAEDIVWHSHVGSPVVRGKAAMRAVLEQMAMGITDIRWRIHHYSINGNQIFMEGVDDFVMLKEQRRVAIPYLGTMIFRRGLISEWRDYFDLDLFRRMKAGEVPSPEIVALADRPGVP